MLLYQSHRRAQVWLNWMAASTAGCGTFAALVELHATVWNSRHVDDVLSVLMLGIVCVGCIFVSQQLVLERIGLSASFWFPRTLCVAFGGLLIGIVAGLICGVVLRSVLPREQAMFWRNHVVVFCIGATTAFGQSLWFSVPLHKRVVWMLCTGLFACLVFTCVATNVFEKSSFTRIGTAIGLMYGLLTGAGLAWIVPTPREIVVEQHTRRFGRRNPIPLHIGLQSVPL